jgi:hypothetical protein
MVGAQVYFDKNLFGFLSQNPNGNLVQFIKWLSNKKEYSLDYRGYKDRIVIRFESVFNEIGQIFNCQSGIHDRTFVQENLVIELPCSSSFIMSLVSGIILTRMFRFKANNQDYLRFKNFVILEDIQGSLNRE